MTLEKCFFIILKYNLVTYRGCEMEKIKRKDAKQFSVSFPMSLLEEIDTICKTNYMTRSSWLVAAAREKVGNERLKKIEQLKKLNQEGDNMT